MIQKEEWAERRLKELKEIVRDFNLTVCNYIDCFEAIDGTLVEGEDAGDINKETVDYYVNQVNEILDGFPPAHELQEFLFKYYKHKKEDDSDDTSDEIDIDIPTT